MSDKQEIEKAVEELKKSREAIDDKLNKAQAQVDATRQEARDTQSRPY